MLQNSAEAERVCRRFPALRKLTHKLSEKHHESFQLALLFDFSRHLYTSCKTLLYYNKLWGKMKEKNSNILNGIRHEISARCWGFFSCNFFFLRGVCCYLVRVFFVGVFSYLTRIFLCFVQEEEKSKNPTQRAIPVFFKGSVQNNSSNDLVHIINTVGSEINYTVFNNSETKFQLQNLLQESSVRKTLTFKGPADTIISSSQKHFSNFKQNEWHKLTRQWKLHRNPFFKSFISL